MTDRCFPAALVIGGIGTPACRRAHNGQALAFVYLKKRRAGDQPPNYSPKISRGGSRANVAKLPELLLKARLFPPGFLISTPVVA
jgi:hypothetical protein